MKAILRDADIVLIDVSSRSANVAREISFTSEVGLGDRIAFLCHAEESGFAASWLGKVQASFESKSPQVFNYGKALEDPEAFDHCLARIALQADKSRRPSRTVLAPTLWRIATLTAGLAVVTCALNAPYVTGLPEY